MALMNDPRGHSRVRDACNGAVRDVPKRAELGRGWPMAAEIGETRHGATPADVRSPGEADSLFNSFRPDVLVGLVADNPYI
jgi:hypothetical protein